MNLQTARILESLDATLLVTLVMPNLDSATFRSPSCFSSSILPGRSQILNLAMAAQATATAYSEGFFFISYLHPPLSQVGFPGGASGKEPTCNAGDIGDAGSIPVLGRYPGEGHGNPLQYSCLENTMDRGAWQATLHGGHKESDTTEAT